MKLFKLIESTASPNMGRNIFLPNIENPVKPCKFTFKMHIRNNHVVLYNGHDSAFNKLRPKYLNYGNIWNIPYMTLIKLNYIELLNSIISQRIIVNGDSLHVMKLNNGKLLIHSSSSKTYGL